MKFAIRPLLLASGGLVALCALAGLFLTSGNSDSPISAVVSKAQTNPEAAFQHHQLVSVMTSLKRSLIGSSFGKGVRKEKLLLVGGAVLAVLAVIGACIAAILVMTAGEQVPPSVEDPEMGPFADTLKDKDAVLDGGKEENGQGYYAIFYGGVTVLVGAAFGVVACVVKRVRGPKVVAPTLNPSDCDGGKGEVEKGNIPVPPEELIAVDPTIEVPLARAVAVNVEVLSADPAIGVPASPADPTIEVPAGPTETVAGDPSASAVKDGVASMVSAGVVDEIGDVDDVLEVGTDDSGTSEDESGEEDSIESSAEDKVSSEQKEPLPTVSGETIASISTVAPAEPSTYPFKSFLKLGGLEDSEIAVISDEQESFGELNGMESVPKPSFAGHPEHPPQMANARAAHFAAALFGSPLSPRSKNNT